MGKQIIRAKELLNPPRTSMAAQLASAEQEAAQRNAGRTEGRCQIGRDTSKER